MAPRKKRTKRLPKKLAKSPARHPKYSDMIAEAISSLKERKGSSRQAILKFIMTNYDVGENKKKVGAHLKLALKRGLEEGTLKTASSRGKGAGSYKIAKQENKLMAKKLKKSSTTKTGKNKKKTASKAITSKKKVSRKRKKVSTAKRKKASSTKGKKASSARQKKSTSDSQKVAKKAAAAKLKKVTTKKTKKAAKVKPKRITKEASRKTATKKPASKQTTNKKTVSKKKVSKKKTASKKKMYYDEDVPFLHGTLLIHVLEARDLPDTDSTFFNINRGDWTDPYVEVSLGDVHLLKTAFLTNNLDPVWNEKFTIQVCHHAGLIKVVVKDKEHIGSQKVGTVLIKTNELLCGNPLEEWFELDTQGEIHIMMQYFPVLTYNEDSKSLNNAYFDPKPNNKVTLYQDAETPQLPVFDGVLNPDGNPYRTTHCWQDMYNAIQAAERFIYITGWSVYTEISFLRGDNDIYDDSNVGELLKRKAESGCKVLVMTWNEKSNDGGFLDGMMGTHDEDTKRYFSGTGVICANVPRTKDSGIAAQFVGTCYTHHQKTIILDAPVVDGTDRLRLVAFIGGLDITDGRYDTPEFPLFNTIHTHHAGDFYSNCTPGSTCETGPRQPWHDIHARVEGPAALDIAINFMDRWSKQVAAEEYQLVELGDDIYDLEAEGPLTEEDPSSWTVQLLRSITSDSAMIGEDRAQFCHRKYGALVDNSIMRGYVNLIRNAQNFIYIENQYFLGSAYSWVQDSTTLSTHTIPMEIAHKIISKISTGEQFKVYVTIPMFPEGNPTDGPIQEILYWQYRTIEAMYKRVAGAIESYGLDAHPTDYLNFYCLGKRESPMEVPEDLVDPDPESAPDLVRQSLRHPIYVHSKLLVVDDDYIVVGSANINQRSLGGNRDTEICIGASQPEHSAEYGDPRGGIHTFRMALWSAHLGGFDDSYQNPSSDECLNRVREVTSEFWEIYTAPEPEHSDIHLLPYPIVVAETGDISSLGSPWDCFPDTCAPVLGCMSSFLPGKLTT